MLDEWQKANRASLEFVESLSNPQRYVRHSKVASHRKLLSIPLRELLQRPTTELGDHPLLAKLPRLHQFTSDGDKLVSAANELFVREERRRYQSLFETIESNPLTDEQQVAVVTDEDRNLVVAAAGSGKTSVIIAKVAHILKQGDIHPSQLAEEEGPWRHASPMVGRKIRQLWRFKLLHSWQNPVGRLLAHYGASRKAH